MKKLMQKIFGLGNNETQVVEEQPASFPIDEHLFRETEPPAQEPSKTMEKESVGKLRDFLDSDHFQQGQAEGYRFHNGASLKSGIQALEKEFRRLLDEEIERLHQDLGKLNLQIAELGGQLPDRVRMLETRVAEIERLIQRCNDQKLKSIESEGWISSAVHQYRKGYEDGLKQYMDEQAFFESKTIL